MPLNNKARAANVIRTRASYFEYSYPRMSVLQRVCLGSNWQIESSRNISDNPIFSIYKLNYVFNISQFRYFIEFFFYYLSPPSSLRSAGATRVPNNSIACIIFRWGNDAAFSWKLMREMPPRALLCRTIFLMTSSGLPMIGAPCELRWASKSAQQASSDLLCFTSYLIFLCTACYCGHPCSWTI